MQTSFYNRKMEHSVPHYTHESMKMTSPPSCKCCWMNEHNQQNKNVMEQRREIPKLIPTYKALQRMASPEIDDSVRVSVIKKAQYIDVPIRKLSTSSIDRQSMDSQYSDKLDDYADSRRSVSPTYQSYDYNYNERREYYKSLQRTREIATIRRDKLTVLQNDDDFKQSHSDSYLSYRDIPSPGYNISPKFFINESQSAESQFVFGSYLESNLRNKYCPELSRGIKKRHRTIFTPSQLRKLEEKFNECNFIVGEDRQLLAKQLKLKEHQVKIWFQNRRTKVKQSARDSSNAEIDIMS